MAAVVEKNCSGWTVGTPEVQVPAATRTNVRTGAPEGTEVAITSPRATPTRTTKTRMIFQGKGIKEGKEKRRERKREGKGKGKKKRKLCPKEESIQKNLWAMPMVIDSRKSSSSSSNQKNSETNKKMHDLNQKKVAALDHLAEAYETFEDTKESAEGHMLFAIEEDAIERWRRLGSTKVVFGKCWKSVAKHGWCFHGVQQVPCSL